jgi:1-deoxy-D-xylulose-5-phosphate reductoisomerase
MTADPARQNLSAPQRLSILGATGSIGSTAFALIDHAPDRFVIESLTAQDNAEKLAALAKRYHPRHVAIGNAAHYEPLKAALSGTGIEVSAGAEAVAEAASRPADVVLSAIVGAAGLKPTLNAIRQGTRVALANKECLVCAGELMLDEIRKHHATLLPVDSEHSAIHQVFDFAHPETVEAIILTASGGPFRTRTLEQMQHVTPEQALNHPNWSMGAKITIDSATMMNKGLELIEAYHLFPVTAQQVEILVHPESIIHSLVRYHDGSTLAQLGEPDMATPIAYALSHPMRMSSHSKPLDLAQIGKLTFEAPDDTRFPALRLAREALQNGASAPIILNAVNEIAVQAFLDHRISFLAITQTVERMLQHLPPRPVHSLEDVEAIDTEARAKTRELLG